MIWLPLDQQEVREHLLKKSEQAETCFVAGFFVGLSERLTFTQWEPAAFLCRRNLSDSVSYDTWSYLDGPATKQPERQEHSMTLSALPTSRAHLNHFCRLSALLLLLCLLATCLPSACQAYQRSRPFPFT